MLTLFLWSCCGELLARLSKPCLYPFKIAGACRSGRVAAVPLVLEARGLDVRLAMMRRLERAGDGESAAILERLYNDEIGHVAGGAHWFDRLCRQRGLDPVATFHDRVGRYFTGALKPPLNDWTRARANMPAAYYAPRGQGVD